MTNLASAAGGGDGAETGGRPDPGRRGEALQSPGAAPAEPLIMTPPVGSHCVGGPDAVCVDPSAAAPRQAEIRAV